MKPYVASLINAVLLILLPLWAYLTSDKPSLTVLIPVFIGVVLLSMNGGLKKENKVISHIAVLVTIITFISLLKPTRGALKREDTMGILRMGILLLSTLWAIVTFIKSFIDVRRNK